MRDAIRKSLFASCTLIALAATAGPADADLVISKGTTTNMSCSNGVCHATAPDAVLNANELANMLSASNVSVFAEGPATELTVTASFRWVTPNKLTLGAYGSINVKDAITVAGPGSLTISANVANMGGLFRLVSVGKISFWDTTSKLVIDNTSYRLFNDIAALAHAAAAHPYGTFALANDYNAAQDGSYPHSPIPTTFRGSFEGLGNAIDGLKIFNNNDVNEEVAFFSELASGGQVSDIRLTNVSFQTRGAFVAPLVAVNGGTVTHSFATGAVTGNTGFNQAEGGLVYSNLGTISRSRTTVNLSQTLGAGGLVYSNAGAISLGEGSGLVSAQSNAGGLAAINTGTISDSDALGSVTVSSPSTGAVGGLVGSSSGTIQRCFATGVVQGTVQGAARSVAGKKRAAGAPQDSVNSMGGLVGFSNGAIAYSYETGSVSRNGASGVKHSMVGGLVGETGSGGTIFQAYSLGMIAQSGRGYVGGVIGYDGTQFGSNQTVYWNLDTTGIGDRSRGAGNIAYDPGLKGVRDAHFRSETLSNFDHQIWAEDANINNGYPYLISNPPPQ